MTMAEIAQLTPYQVRNIYLRGEDRDEGGGGTPILSYQQLFWASARSQGLEEHQIQEAWSKYLQEQG